jgi:Sulfotransferase domain
MTRSRRRWFRRFQRELDSFENAFVYKPDDVVIVSYPKSGSTWLRFVMAHLLCKTFSRQHQEVDFLQMQLMVPEISLDAYQNGVNFQSLPSPRMMRSHALYNPRFPRVVYMLRDPRDVLVSYYYHFQKFHNFGGTLLDFMQSDVRKVEWDQHVNSWIFENPSLRNLCVIRYEDMLSDAFIEVQKIIRFASLDRTPAEIRRAIEKSGFDELRELEEKKGLGYVEDQNKEIRFIREGKKGGWQESFGEAEKAYVKEKLGTILVQAGYESSFSW